MVTLAQLWLPVLLSAVGTFIASSILHMVLRFWHSPDYRALPNEDEARTALRKGGAVPGMYIIPYCPPEKMKDPGMLQKFTEGPVGFLVLRPNGMFSMGRSLGLWFCFCLLVAIFAGYLGGVSLGVGAASRQVFRLVTTAAFMGFAFGSIPQGIWWGQPWRAVGKDVVDGLIYAAVTGAVFALLWPHPT